jgi:hypothetical protein
MHIFAWLVCEKDRPHFSVGPFYLQVFLIGNFVAVKFSGWIFLTSLAVLGSV